VWVCVSLAQLAAPCLPDPITVAVPMATRRLLGTDHSNKQRPTSPSVTRSLPGLARSCWSPDSHATAEGLVCYVVRRC
jgi:hypothetical protein